MVHIGQAASLADPFSAPTIGIGFDRRPREFSAYLTLESTDVSFTPRVCASCMVSNTRLYGAAIAVTSGLYSLWSASMVSRMVASGWLMGVLGVVVIIHGALLLSDQAHRLGSASGPLMIVYAVVMLLNQSLLGTGLMDDGSGMGMNGEMGGSTMTTGMGWDGGMVALALLMLVSGLIMTRDGEPHSDTRSM